MKPLGDKIRIIIVWLKEEYLYPLKPLEFYYP